MRSATGAWLALLAVASLAACGGGGSGDSGGGGTPAAGGGTPTNGGGTPTNGGTTGGSGLASPNFISPPNNASGAPSLSGFGSDASFDETFQPSVSVRGSEVAFFENAPTSAINGFNIYTAPGATLTASSASQGLEYTAFGVWALGDLGPLLSGGTAVNVTDSAGFFGGVRGGAIPDTGTASYAGTSMAVEVDGSSNAVNYYTGTMRADANFANRNLSINVDLASTNSQDQFSFVSRNIRVTRDTGAYGGTFTSPGDEPAFTGSTNGRLMGPSQNEIGGAFNVTDGSSTVLGAYGGARR